ncbi:MAG: hypothetical protein VB141_12270, partial [Burkholderia gladioli]
MTRADGGCHLVNILAPQEAEEGGRRTGAGWDKNPEVAYYVSHTAILDGDMANAVREGHFSGRLSSQMSTIEQPH